MKKIKTNLAKSAVLTALSLPAITFAYNQTLYDLVSLTIRYLQVAIYLIISLAIVTFIWNVFRYFFTEKDKKEAGMYVLYSVIGFFIILTFWGLVALLSNTLQLPTGGPLWPFGGGGGGYYSSGSSFYTNAGSSNQLQNTAPAVINPTKLNSGNSIPSASNSGNAGNSIPPGSNTGYGGNYIPPAGNQ